MEYTYVATTRIYYFPLIIYLLHEHAFNKQKMNSLPYPFEGNARYSSGEIIPIERKSSERFILSRKPYFCTSHNVKLKKESFYEKSCPFIQYHELDPK